MTFFFFIVAFLLIASALGVVLYRAPVYSALCLVANLALVAALYAMLGAHFLAAAQVVVYAGAIMVLVLFVIMLLNMQVEERVVPLSAYMIVSALIVVAFGWYIVPILYNGFGEGSAVPVITAQSSVDTSTAQLGQLIFGRYLAPFEIASLLIMVAVVAAVMLAKRVEPKQSIEKGVR